MANIHKARNPDFWLPKRQPVRTTYVNPANRLKLRQAFLCRNGVPQQVAPGARAASVTAATVSVGVAAGGVGMSFSSGGMFTAPEIGEPPAVFTMEALVQIGVVGSDEPILGYAELGTPGTSDRQFSYNIGGHPQFYIFDGSPTFVTGASFLTAGVVTHLIGVSDGASISLYRDGVLEGSTAAGNGFSGFVNPQLVAGAQAIDAVGSGVVVTPTSTMFLALVWDGPMTAAEVAMRSADPYGFLLPNG